MRRRGVASVQTESTLVDKRLSSSIIVFLGLVLAQGSRAYASWEVGARGGFDSNVSLSVNDGKEDAYLTGYVSFFREPSGESRLGWHLASTLEGSAYLELNDLNGASASVAPGLTFVPFPGWSLEAGPFLQGKIVKDSEQSALTFGGKVNLWQQLGGRFYTGEHYIYQDSRADTETFSFTEHTVGVLLGVNWTRRFYTEASYDFSYGDSFVTLSTSTTVVEGRGRHRRASQVFGGEVVREKVARHALGASLGIDWTEALFSRAGYTYTLMDGDLGSADVHSTYAEMGYRF